MQNPYIHLSDQDLLKQCTLNPHKTTGPGGQRKNKKLTAVRLTHKPTSVSVVAGNSRSQAENRKHALKKLRFELARNIRYRGDISEYELPARVRPYIYRAQSIRINPSNPVYIHVFNVVLDLLFLFKGDHKKSARYLGTTASQLVRLMQKDSKLLTEVNNIRSRNNLPALKSK
jgi:hypothetical protein